jgi:hypothetical protein
VHRSVLHRAGAGRGAAARGTSGAWADASQRAGRTNLAAGWCWGHPVSPLLRCRLPLHSLPAAPTSRLQGVAETCHLGALPQPSCSCSPPPMPLLEQACLQMLLLLPRASMESARRLGRAVQSAAEDAQHWCAAGAGDDPRAHAPAERVALIMSLRYQTLTMPGDFAPAAEARPRGCGCSTAPGQHLALLQDLPQQHSYRTTPTLTVSYIIWRNRCADVGPVLTLRCAARQYVGRLDSDVGLLLDQSSMISSA